MDLLDYKRVASITWMELEELMTNRSLLEKMSEDDSLQTNGYRKSQDDSLHTNGYRKPQKQVIIQENHSNNNKPKDLRIEYKNNANGNLVQSAVVTSQQDDAVVLDGYGCQCPKRFLKTIKIFWTLFLILYIFGMPVVLYHLYSKLSIAKTRLQRLENEFDDHLLLTSANKFRTAASKQSPDNSIDSVHTKIIPDLSNALAEDVLRKHYSEFSQFQLRTNKVVEEINRKIKLYEKRLSFVDQIEKRWNTTRNNGTKCDCKNLGFGLRGRNSTLCSCNQAPSIPKAVYTRWGKSSCPDNGNTTQVYNGYIGNSFHTHQGGGSNYVCLPTKPKYQNSDPHSNVENRGYIHGVEFELGDSNIFDTKGVTGQYFDAFCSVCESKHKYNSLMIPGTNVCPVGWKREYYGYLMAQKKYLKRTEFICVDHKPDLTVGTENWGKGAFLHFVETRCGVLPCRKGMYQDYLEMTCVMCSR